MHGGPLAIWEMVEIKQDVNNVDQALPLHADCKQGYFMIYILCFFAYFDEQVKVLLVIWFI